jgi:hypothetical protein
LRDHFVCIAIDNTDHPQLTPGERAFVLDRGLKGCTWGMSTFTAGGKILEMGGGFEAKGVAPMLKRALAAYKPDDKVDIPERTDQERAKLKRPPEGGLVLSVSWKLIGDYPPEGSPTTGMELYADFYRHAVGMDRLWVRKDEAESLARGELAASLKKRMLPHVSYAVAGDVKTMDLALKDGRMTGAFRTNAGDTGDLLGFVEAKNGRLTRFDLLVKGVGEQVIDCGFSASLTVLPKGKKLPVAVLFTLLDPADFLAQVVPLRAGSENYLGGSGGQ